MPIGTPFHERTSALCDSHEWREWSGYRCPATYNDFMQPEYAAIRNAAGVIDVSPLYKYRVSGRDAAILVDHVMTHDAQSIAVGRVLYTPWCDGAGKVLQEGTVFRLAENRFRVCAAEPAMRWLQRNAAGFDVEISDESTAIAALSVQGPASRAILDDLCDGAVTDLKFFGTTDTRAAGVPISVSRTGYTGDLGYEVWVPVDHALAVWDALMAVGKKHQIRPCGLAAMDTARVEAGFVLLNVDYIGAAHAVLEEHKVTPFELGLGWAVKLERGNFLGRRALLEAAEKGPRQKVVGLMVDWEPLEEVFLGADVMPDFPMTPCRESVPVYSPNGDRQIGRVTTRVWSKLLKKYIGIATLEAGYAGPGSEVAMEVTVNFARRRVAARVEKMPFFRPERMRA